MTPAPSNHDLEHRARTLYRQAASDIDTATVTRLREARERALTARHRPLRWMMPAGAVAATVLAAVIAWYPPHRVSVPNHAPTAVAASADNDLPPDPDNADPAMVEDMGFYAWLADQPAARTPRH